MRFLLKHIWTIAGLIIGALAGYFYWREAGCTGSCRITSSPLNSTAYGALLGGLLFSMFKKEKNVCKP